MLANFKIVMKMHVLPINITQEQKTYLFERKEQMKIDVAVQIREAIDDYIDKHGDAK